MKIYNMLKKNLSGFFTHIRTNGVPYIIGGVARNIYIAILTGDVSGNVSANDRDFTVVGPAGTCFRTDKRPRNKKRIEVEYDAPHASLISFFLSRDFTFNQVAVGQDGRVYVSDEAVFAYRQKRIVSAQSPTLRLGARAIRFKNELGWEIETSLVKYIEEHINAIKSEDVFQRYLRQGFNMEF